MPHQNYPPLSDDFVARITAALDAAHSPATILPDLDRCEAAGHVFADYVARSGVVFVTDAEPRRDFYRPSEDLISLQPADVHKFAAEYHRTVFHEAAHSTGHETRLGRNLTRRFGHELYAREEFNAEITSGIVCTALGLRDEIEKDHWDHLQLLHSVWQRHWPDLDVELHIDAAWLAARLILGAHATWDTADDARPICRQNG